VAAIPCGAADPPSRTIFLHYDYMVAPDHSHAPTRARSTRSARLPAPRDHAATSIPSNAIPERGSSRSVRSIPACAASAAVSLYDVKRRYFEPHGNHRLALYALFAHRVITPDASHAEKCPRDPACSNRPDPEASGFAGAARAQLRGRVGPVLGDGEVLVGTEAATFMHELGHNLGLTHGGASDEACPSTSRTT
jgi:hypothetical protein